MKLEKFFKHIKTSKFLNFRVSFQVTNCQSYKIYTIFLRLKNNEFSKQI